MVRIRMQRFGRTHRPFYRINAIDIRTRRNGKVIENLGWYNPMAKEGEEQINLKEDRIKEWLEKGARPSDTVMDMLGNRDLLSDKMKAEWEAGRALDRDRVTCKQAVAKAEAALKELEAARRVLRRRPGPAHREGPGRCRRVQEVRQSRPHRRRREGPRRGRGRPRRTQEGRRRQEGRRSRRGREEGRRRSRRRRG